MRSFKPLWPRCNTQCLKILQKSIISQHNEHSNSKNELNARDDYGMTAFISSGASAALRAARAKSNLNFFFAK